MNNDGRAFYGENEEKESEGNKYEALAYSRGGKSDGWIKKDGEKEKGPKRRSQ